jgi:hypothetical protein
MKVVVCTKMYLLVIVKTMANKCSLEITKICISKFLAASEAYRQSFNDTRIIEINLQCLPSVRFNIVFETHTTSYGILLFQIGGSKQLQRDYI